MSRPRNTITFADGACEGRSRSEEEVMQGHRRRRATQRSPATPINPKGDGGTAWYSWDETLARTIHKFSTAVAKSSGVLHRLRCATRKRVPPASSTYCREYVCGGRPANGCPRACRNPPRSALSALRDKNLWINRASQEGHNSRAGCSPRPRRDGLALPPGATSHP